MQRFILPFLAACAPPVADGDPPTDDSDVVPEACGAAERTVSFTTSDGVTLAADLWPAAQADAPAVILFHMAPPANDRKGYPPRVRARLHDQGWTVLNVDRRGAGDSGGVAADATGAPEARLDLEAAVRFLLDDARGCPADADALLLVGASNGTTALYDYVLDHDAALPDPAGLALLSPGAYTIANHGASKEDLGDAWRIQLPLLWLYPTTEPFSNDFRTDAPGAWEFVERGTEHGTRMFDGAELEEDTLADLVRYLGDAASLNPMPQR